MMNRLIATLANRLRESAPSGVILEFELITGWGTCWPTAFVGSMLAHLLPATILDGSGLRELLAAQATYLVNHTRVGRWGFNESVPPDNDSTAWALFFLSMTDPDSYNRYRLPWLETIFSAQGGVGTYLASDLGARHNDFRRWLVPTLSVTAASALAAAQCPDGSYFHQAAEKFCADWIESRGIVDMWWDGPWYPALVCGLAFPSLKELIWSHVSSQERSDWFANAVYAVLGQLFGYPMQDTITWMAEALNQTAGGIRGGARMLIPHPNQTQTSGMVYPDVNGRFTETLVLAALAFGQWDTPSLSPAVKCQEPISMGQRRKGPGQHKPA